MKDVHKTIKVDFELTTGHPSLCGRIRWTGRYLERKLFCLQTDPWMELVWMW